MNQGKNTYHLDSKCKQQILNVIWVKVKKVKLKGKKRSDNRRPRMKWENF